MAAAAFHLCVQSIYDRAKRSTYVTMHQHHAMKHTAPVQETLPFGLLPRLKLFEYRHLLFQRL